jgi:DNA adenine methylase
MLTINSKKAEKCISFNIPTFIKWAGGKTQLLPQLLPLFPNHVDRYFEPFLGSGAVFFAIKQLFPLKKVVLSDNTSELINCYKIVRNCPNDLLNILVSYKKRHSKDHYYEVRSIDSSSLTPIERAARFIYLNKTCFNGLYRVNSRGQFNVPIGSYLNPNIVNEEVLFKASLLLQDVEIKERDFSDVFLDVIPGDFIYFDPPYYPLSSTAYFTSYTSNSFSEIDQLRLHAVFKSLDDKHCFVAQSNSDTTFIRELYKGYRIETVMARRAINSDATKRGVITELVILNY